MSMKRKLSLVLALAAATACRPDDQRTDTIDPNEALQQRENFPPGVLAQLDSGSEAFRLDDFERARTHYRRATDLAPEVAAGWFGVYMAEHALGNVAAAEEAMNRAREQAPGASLIHPTAADTIP